MRRARARTVGAGSSLAPGLRNASLSLEPDFSVLRIRARLGLGSFQGLALSASDVKESAKNSSAGRPQRAVKSRSAACTMTGAPQA